MRLGKYWISIRKLWTAFLGVVAYLTSSEIVPVHYRPAVQIIGAIVLAFNISPTEKFTPQLFETDSLKAYATVEPLIPANVASDLADLVAVLKAGQAGYTTGYLLPPHHSASVQATLGDDVKAAIASGATLVGTPPPPVVNAAPAPATQTVGVALVSPPVLPVVDGQSA